MDGSGARERVPHEKEIVMCVTSGKRHRALNFPRGRGIAPLRWLRTGGLLVALALGLGMVWRGADVQPPAKVHRIGYLRRTTPQPLDLDAFRQGLRALGYIEGTNFVIEQRYADTVTERVYSQPKSHPEPNHHLQPTLYSRTALRLPGVAESQRSASSDKGCTVPIEPRSMHSFNMDIFLLHTGAPWPLCVLWMATSWLSWGEQVHSILS